MGSTKKAPEKPWIGIKWACCNAYTRVYREPEVKFYLGRCPRCLRTIRIGVSPQGTNTRMFIAR